AAAGAAALASDDRSVRELLGQFGQAFGQAFQAHDDLLGIWASTERTGKVELNDLIKRKKTLPVVLAFERASPNVRVRLAGLLEKLVNSATGATKTVAAEAIGGRGA